MQMRHELKFFINFADYLVLCRRLAALCKPDPHAGAHGEYRVRSLYFDNYRDKVLLEKINGVNRREKFRVRMYNADAAFIRLEKKIKVSGLCAKAAAPLTGPQAAMLARGEYAFLLHSEAPLAVELYSKMQGQVLRPARVIEYTRKAFLYPAGNVRVTLDSGVRTGADCHVFLDASPPLLDTDTGIVMEIKYDAFLPEVIRRAVNLPGRRMESFSKYAAGRRFG